MKDSQQSVIEKSEIITNLGVGNRELGFLHKYLENSDNRVPKPIFHPTENLIWHFY